MSILFGCILSMFWFWTSSHFLMDIFFDIWDVTCSSHESYDAAVWKIFPWDILAVLLFLRLVKCGLIVLQDNVVLILTQLSVIPSFPQKWSHVHVKQTILGLEWLQTLLPLSFLWPPLPHTHTSLTQSRGPYLCLDHASSLVSQVLQGSGNINLFSTCNRPKIGLSSKQWSNPAHICQSLFILGSLWKSAAIENYYIHPSKDLDKGHWLFLDKICKRIFLGPGAIMHSNTPHTGFHVRVVFKNRFRWCPCRQSTNIQECARAHISKLITMIYSRSAAVILMIKPCNSCLPSAGISCCWACFGFTSLWS